LPTFNPMNEKKEINIPEIFPEVLGFLSNIKSLAEILRHDIATCLDRTEKYPKDEVWRRLAVRCSFSMIDSLIYSLKQIAYSVAIKIECGLSLKEKDFLREYRIKDGKNIPCYSKFSINFPSTLNLFAKVFHTDYKFPEGKEWENLKDAIKIRDRITHPKLVSDLSVSRNDLIQSNDACSWALTEVLDELLKKMRDQILERSRKEKFEGKELEQLNGGNK
jgi:hypothetical protein